MLFRAENHGDPVADPGQEAVAARGELGLVERRLRRKSHWSKRETEAKHQTQAAARRDCSP
jgi:hypothetical protein